MGGWWVILYLGFPRVPNLHITWHKIIDCQNRINMPVFEMNLCIDLHNHSKKINMIDRILFNFHMIRAVHPCVLLVMNTNCCGFIIRYLDIENVS